MTIASDNRPSRNQSQTEHSASVTYGLAISHQLFQNLQEEASLPVGGGRRGVWPPRLRIFHARPGACSQAVAARGCRSLAPMTMSHSMIASSPNITGNVAFHTLS